MSLKLFVNDKYIQSKLKELIQKPKFNYKKTILAEPLNNRYTIIGIAFDYLMRIRLYKLNNDFVSKFNMIAEEEIPEGIFDKNKLEISKGYVNNAKQKIDKYMNDGILSKDLLSALIQISYIDIARRSGIVDPDFGLFTDEDILDLENLYSLMIAHDWRCKDQCKLNPNFGITSALVGGADADLIIDDMLIDIKVLANPGMTRQHFNQLFGYYFLSRIQGDYTINKLGIYSARYSDLITFNVEDILDTNQIEKLTDWFYKEAYSRYGSLYELHKKKIELLDGFSSDSFI